MLHELIDNPPKADEVVISHIKPILDENGETIFPYCPTDRFPCTIIYDDCKEVNRFVGFISTESININIKDYETKRMV